MTPLLTPRQAMLLRCSDFDPRDGNGYGVELRGAGEWAAARKLVKLGLGWIEGGKPNGSDLPGLFFANHDGTAIHFAEHLEEFLRRKGHR